MRCQDGELAGAAFEAAAALDSYEADLLSFGEWSKSEVRFRLCCDLQRVRSAFITLPAFWAAWLTVLISHYELLDALDGARSQPELVTAIRQHANRIACVAELCRHMCGSMDPQHLVKSTRVAQAANASGPY